MRHDRYHPPDRPHWAALCLLYAVVMLYSSTIIGPSGVNFVYRQPADALHAFLNTAYVAHGSDQRADWIGNLLMLVPFGFLVLRAVWPHQPRLRPVAACAALLLCIATVLGIKFLQLYFPPRTVTLNYILAQSIGSLIGLATGWIWNARIIPLIGDQDIARTLVLMLRLYAVALILFVLMPLDFALDMTDLRAQIDRLPDTVLALPGSDRPPVIRVILIVVATAAFLPVGMLLTFVKSGTYQVSRALRAVAVRGLCLTTGLFALDAVVISAYPVLPSVLYRTCGIVLGAAAIKWLVRRDAAALWRRLRALVPWMVAPYLMTVLLVNHLLSIHWLSLPQAVAQAYPLGLLPLFDYYIVTKAEAAKNIIGHFALYLPVGVLLRLRYPDQTTGAAFGAAATLSLLVEAGRYLRPGLQGDINAVVVAGLAAAFAAHSTLTIRSMLSSLQRSPAANTQQPMDGTGQGRTAERANDGNHC